MIRAAVLISGGGTNLQALLDAQADGRIHSGRIALVVSSKAGAYGLLRAQKAGVETEVLECPKGMQRAEYTHALTRLLKSHDIDMVVFAGFMLILTDEIVKAYPSRMLNIHPSLIPSFCGEGMYGLRV
ncbi:MAG: formyltransferase family protein, partial [Eubacteriales bacterium]|nr:formyltransferase family protein [Eubacteriales bacterium]